MAKVPLVYPKIPGSGDAPLARCVAFEKYDGTNLHWTWDAEFEWATFGTRRDSFYLDQGGIPEFRRAHPGLEEAPDVFQRDTAGPLEEIIRKHGRYRSASKITFFTEFMGPRSFAGMHKKDDPKELVLFDVQVDGRMLDPWEFLGDWGGVNAARVVYEGKLTGQFAEDVRNGKYGVAEGVVCKGRKGDAPFMVKIKTRAYGDKLRQAFKDKWEDFWE